MFGIAILFLLIMWIISLPLKNKTYTKEGYFISSRNLGATTLSFTIAATTTGGSAIVVSLKLIEKYGAYGILMDIAGSIGLIVLSLTLADKVRETQSLTLPSILSKSLNKNEYKIIAAALIIAEVFWISLSLKSIQIIGQFSDFQLTIITFFILGYSITAGQWGVSRTDILQFLIILIGLTYYIINPSNKINILLKIPDFFLFYLCTLMLLSHIIGPDIYSKLLSAKNKKTAKKGALGGGILKLFFSTALLLAIKNGFSIKTLNIFIFVIVFSAITSSIDSMLITSSSIFCEDLMKTSNRKIIRATTILITFFSYTISIYSKELLSLVSSGYTALLVTITFPVISYFSFKKINRLSLILPITGYVITFIFTKSIELSFFASILSGGLALAYTKIKS